MNDGPAGRAGGVNGQAHCSRKWLLTLDSARALPMRRSPGRYHRVLRSNLFREKPHIIGKHNCEFERLRRADDLTAERKRLGKPERAQQERASPPSRPSQRENGGPVRSQHRTLSEDPRCNKADRRRRRRSNRKTTGLRTHRRQPTTRSALYSMLARALPIQSKRQRVAPFGSFVATATALWGMIAYRYQGGGPALGALYGAVNAPPLTRAGQPCAA